METRTITAEVKEQLLLMAKRLPEIRVKPNSNNKVSETVNHKDKGLKITGRVVVAKKADGIPIYGPVVKGEVLIANKVTFQDGDEVKPNKRYRLQIGWVMVDHYKHLELAYLREGLTGVSNYIAKTKEESIK